jgi:hypothetical protein
MSGRAAINFSDSFDSTDPKGTIRKNGEVACFNGQVNLGSAATISGDLLLGPLATNLSGRVSGQTYHDLNMDLPDVVPPSPYWLPAAFANKSVDGTYYRYVFDKSGDHEYTINSPGSIYVGPDTKVTLQVQSANFLAPNVTVAGVNQHAGQLVIYGLKPGFTFGDVMVESGKASKLVYLGGPANTSLTLSNNSFIGTIYAPDANFTYNVGKSGRKADFTGSLMAKSVRINNSAAFHFDEDLLRNSPMGRGFLVTSWREL